MHACVHDNIVGILMTHIYVSIYLINYTCSYIIVIQLKICFLY